MSPCAQEDHLWGHGLRLLAGVDEAGRGPLAGPVVAAAVAFPRGVRVEGVRDSKTLSERRREGLFERILQTASGVGIGVVDHGEIDRLNILNATFKAMHAAIAALRVPPEHLLIDGNLFRAEVDRGCITMHGSLYNARRWGRELLSHRRGVDYCQSDEGSFDAGVRSGVPRVRLCGE